MHIFFFGNRVFFGGKLGGSGRFGVGGVGRFGDGVGDVILVIKFFEGLSRPSGTNIFYSGYRDSNSVY